MMIDHALERIMANYVAARRTSALSADHPLWALFKSLQTEFAGLRVVKRRPTLRIKWSMGQGAWARIPWLGVLDERETNATSRGIYVIYLFREDMSGVYLTFNQGVTEARAVQGSRDWRSFVCERADQLRDLCCNLPKRGFCLDNQIDLRTKASLGEDYAVATIAHRFYAKERFPKQDQLEGDLDALLKSYDKCITGGTRRKSTRELRRRD